MLDVSVSRFTRWTARDLAELQETAYVYEHATQARLVAVVPYKEYLKMQNIILKTHQILEGREP